MGLDQQTPFPAGTIFTYTATLPGYSFFSSADDTVNQAAAALAQDGITVLSSSVGSSSLFDQVAAASLFSTTPFTVTLKCQDNNQTDVALDAQQQCDIELGNAAGSPPTSSSITDYQVPAGSTVSTGQPGQASLPSANPLANLSGGSEALIAIVVIVVVLIVAVLFAPEHVAHAASVFA